MHVSLHCSGTGIYLDSVLVQPCSCSQLLQFNLRWLPQICKIIFWRIACTICWHSLLYVRNVQVILHRFRIKISPNPLTGIVPRIPWQRPPKYKWEGTRSHECYCHPGYETAVKCSVTRSIIPTRHLRFIWSALQNMLTNLYRAILECHKLKAKSKEDYLESLISCTEGFRLSPQYFTCSSNPKAFI